MNSPINLGDKGFTLVEVLLAITILTLIMLMGAAILIQIFNIVPASNERMSTRQLAEINLSRLSSNIKEATEISVNDNEIIIEETGTKKTIKHENKTITKNGAVYIKNIEKFNIEAFNKSGQENLFLISIEQCNDDCSDTIELERQVLRRN